MLARRFTIVCLITALFGIGMAMLGRAIEPAGPWAEPSGHHPAALRRSA